MKRLAVALLASSLAYCSTQIRTAQQNVQGPVDDPAPRVATNLANVRCSYAPEWAFNRTAPKDSPPEIGIALSGGGMRAAAYSIGALSGLQKLGYLEKADVISAASGGAYAAGWYATQKIDTQPTDELLFHDCEPGEPGSACRYQHHLANHGRLVNRRRTAFALLTDTVMFPVNLLVNGVFGWHENTTGHRRFYERALVSEFFTRPEGPHVRYTFDQLRPATAAGQIPLIIINTTAAIDDDANHYGADFRNTVYELSPVRFGSDAFGYHSTNYPMDLPRTVSVSGAAADLSVLASGNVQKTLLSALNLDLGYFVDNRGHLSRDTKNPVTGCVEFEPYPDSRFALRKWKFRAVPFPVYAFLPHWAKDAQGLRTYLSDGGHSENLGAFSLIRRLVRNIVIIDASGDSNFLFHDYRQLQQSVLQSLNANLQVPAIEDASKLPTVEERACAIAKNPVMRGTVTYFPFPNEPDDRRVLNIVYVKLSYDARSTTKYQDFPHVIAYAMKHAKKFPFQGLFDQTYSPQQYRAYRDLAFATILYGQETIRSQIKVGVPATR